MAALVFGILILFLIDPSLAEDSLDFPSSCVETFEREYVLQIESLMHHFEQADVSPKEFEKMREQLLNRRELQMSTCISDSSKISFVEKEPPFSQSVGAESSRAPSSVFIEKKIPAHTHGASSSVSVFGATDNVWRSQESLEPAEEEYEYIYHGERVPVNP